MNNSEEKFLTLSLKTALYLRLLIGMEIVGPVCESSDIFASEREITEPIPGEILAIMDTGAYGFVASSNYNSRCRPPEVLVEGTTYRLIRRRETVSDLILDEADLIV